MLELASFIGGLVPTGLLSALFVWLSGKFLQSVTVRALGSNVLALIGCTIAGGFGFAHGGPPVFEAAFFRYLLPQLVWLAIWFFVLKGREARAAK